MLNNGLLQVNLEKSIYQEPSAKLKSHYNEENKFDDIYEARNQTKLTLRKKKVLQTLENERRIRMMVKNAPKKINEYTRFNLNTLQNIQELTNEYISSVSFKEKLNCINYMLERNNYDSKVFSISIFFELVDLIQDEICDSEMSLFIIQPMISNLLSALRLVYENIPLAVSKNNNII
jgi:hypothetical protein